MGGITRVHGEISCSYSTHSRSSFFLPSCFFIPTHDKSPTMRSSSLVSVLWTWALSGLLITTAAADVLATFTPCPECPQSVMPAPITITTSQCQVQPSCTTYDWVSTTIPYPGGASST